MKDDYYLDQSEPNKSCLLALRQMIRSADDRIEEAIKWSIPCFMLKGKTFCFLNIDRSRNAPYLLFSDGNLLQHPALEAGNRTRMKVLHIHPYEDLPVETIAEILQEAISLRLS